MKKKRRRKNLSSYQYFPVRGERQNEERKKESRELVRLFLVM